MSFEDLTIGTPSTTTAVRDRVGDFFVATSASAPSLARLKTNEYSTQKWVEKICKTTARHKFDYTIPRKSIVKMIPRWNNCSKSRRRIESDILFLS